ncbi:MAG TPA: hypothetical protein VIH52_04535 [Candidatus Nanoarchaeia archaeon]
MPKAAPKTPELNIELLPKENIDVESSSLLHWILTVGRYLIIFTEVIAIGTFLFSIYLSKQKNDLRTNIRANQAQIDNFQECDPKDLSAFCEDRFRLIQEQVNQVLAVRDANLPQNAVIDEFLKLLPTEITLEGLIVNGTEIIFSGEFPAEQQLQTLVESFGRSDKVTSLDITDLTKELNFKFTAKAQVNASAFLNQGGK